MAEEAPKDLKLPHETDPAWVELRSKSVDKLKKLLSEKNPDRLQVEMARQVLSERGGRGGKKSSKANREIPDYRTEIKKIMQNEESSNTQKKIDDIYSRYTIENNTVQQEFGFSREKLKSISPKAKEVFFNELSEALGTAQVQNIDELDFENENIKEHIALAWSKALLKDKGVI